MRKYIAVMLLAALGWGCHSVPFPSYTRHDDGEYIASVVDPIAGSRIVMRVVLTVPGAKAVFTLYAGILAPTAIRMAAVSDIGSTMFDVSLGAGVATVIQGSAMLGDGFLADHLVRDLAAAILGPTVVQSVVVHTADGARAIFTRRGSDDLLRCRGKHGDEVVIYRGTHGRLESTITIDRHAVARDGVAAHPTAFTILDARGNWTARVEVVEWVVADKAALNSR